MSNGHKYAYWSLKKQIYLRYNQISRKALHIDNLIPAVRVTTRTDERPATHAVTQKGQ